MVEGEGCQHIILPPTRILPSSDEHGVHSLQVEGTIISDHATMAEATFAHFETLLGSWVDCEFSLDLDFLGTQ